jgi:CBS domain-containing protein
MSEKPSVPSVTTQVAFAQDIMTTDVVSIPPDLPVRDIAKLLFEKRISAVPVVNSGGVPIGMVSEGDLLGREEQERLSRGDWWLAVAGGTRTLDSDKKDGPPTRERTAGDVMSAPLVTITEKTRIDEIARLLAIYHIKRAPVVRDERLVGIVSRADLVRGVAMGLAVSSEPTAKAPHRDFFSSFFGQYHLPARETVAGIRQGTQSEPAAPRDETRLGAADFRHLVEDFHRDEARHANEARREAAKQRQVRARLLIDAHVFDDGWCQILHQACAAAEHGEKESMLLRFPSQFCIDGGRAINVHEANWPASLRGEPAELYLRWERDLKPRGFRLSARTMDFPEGKPGDIGLFLVWTE